uniref:Ig-like domain-containing protein n=1 Tax=Xiphophorus maculatus TaxID=8083 RepID=A0A3B5Q8N5_XIPMA
MLKARPLELEIRITAATPLPEMSEDSSEDRPQALPEKTPEVASDDGTSQTLKHKFTFSFDVVGEAPCVVTELENVTCPEGSTAVLECLITGDPVPEAMWYFNNTCLDAAANKYQFFSPVHFLNSPADEGGKTDPNGVSLDESRFLSQVQGIPPAFLKPLIKKRVFENDSLTFYAEVFGLPSPDVRWFFNKTQLVADDRVRMDRDADNITLVIHNVTKADQGEYICEAVNYVGEARSVALVVIF